MANMDLLSYERDSRWMPHLSWTYPEWTSQERMEQQVAHRELAWQKIADKLGPLLIGAELGSSFGHSDYVSLDVSDEQEQLERAWEKAPLLSQQQTRTRALPSSISPPTQRQQQQQKLLLEAQYNLKQALNRQHQYLREGKASQPQETKQQHHHHDHTIEFASQTQGQLVTTAQQPELLLDHQEKTNPSKIKQLDSNTKNQNKCLRGSASPLHMQRPGGRRRSLAPPSSSSNATTAILTLLCVCACLCAWFLYMTLIPCQFPKIFVFS